MITLLISDRLLRRPERERKYRRCGEQSDALKSLKSKTGREKRERERESWRISSHSGRSLHRTASVCCRRMITSSKTTLAFLIYGLLVQCNVCSPLSYPKIRMETAGFDEEGNSLTDVTFDSDQITIRSSPAVTEDAYTLFSPPSKRLERHADGMFNKAYRKALGQLSARKYLHTLMAKRVGGGSTTEDDNEPLSKRHSDGVFTDSYSRYRKQMAVKKYLATVLGKSPEDLDLHQFLQDVDFGVLPDEDEIEAFLLDWLRQFSSEFPAL